MNAGLASFMKSSLVFRIMWSIGIDFSRPRSNSQSKMMRVTTSAVNKLEATPKVRVKPKPLTEPVPKKIKMTDDMSVVTCESKIVPNARS